MIARTLLLLLGLLIVGCSAPPDPGPIQNRTNPLRGQIQPKPLLTSSAQYGNELEIIISALTNRVDWPGCELLPLPRRLNIQLSTDNGSNYVRTLAHGLPVTNGAISYTYSLPWWEESLISESARVRVTDLEGTVMGESMGPFTIAGIFWHRPAGSAVLTHGTYVDLEWAQAGVGTMAEFGYLTPTTPFTVLATFSNLVSGVNQVNWRVTGLPYPLAQVRLALRSITDPLVHGETRILSAE